MTKHETSLHADLDLCDISDNILHQHRGDGGEHDRNVSVLILDQSDVYELVRIKTRGLGKPLISNR